MRLHGGYEGHKAMGMITPPTPVSSKTKPVEESSTPFSALLKAVEVTKERELASEASSDAGSSKQRKKQSHPKQKVQEVRFCEEPTLVERSPSEGSHHSSFDESFNLFSSEDPFVVDDNDVVDIEQQVSSGSDIGSSVENSPNRLERDMLTLSPTPSPSDGGSARKKKRPENLVLKVASEMSEPSVFNDSDDVDSVHLTTPPPYTPPPILSPHVTGLLASPMKSPRMSLMTPVITPHSAVPSSAKFNIPWIPRRISK